MAQITHTQWAEVVRDLLDTVNVERNATQSTLRSELESSVDTAVQARVGLLAQDTLTASASTLSYSGIPDFYTLLDIVLVSQSDGGSQTDVYISFNGDANTANYECLQTQTTYITTTGTTTVLKPAATRLIGVQPSNGTAALFSATFVRVYKYALSVYTVYDARSHAFNWSNVAGDSGSYTVRGLWKDTSAITSITLAASSSGFNAGTFWQVYGWR